MTDEPSILCERCHHTPSAHHNFKKPDGTCGAPDCRCDEYVDPARNQPEVFLIAKAMTGSLFHRITEQLDDSRTYQRCRTACYREIVTVEKQTVLSTAVPPMSCRRCFQ